VAAAVIVLLGVSQWLWWSVESFVAPVGSHLAVVLPDGSKVELNSESDLSFHRYRWLLQRRVNLRGEAFFEVAKGKRFDVVSDVATTSVVGTSFNVLARAENYTVTCLTGKVAVAVQSAD
jgi:ferric-dicitrate binding protein FerR (iron transport regulator)